MTVPERASRPNIDKQRTTWSEGEIPQEVRTYLDSSSQNSFTVLSEGDYCSSHDTFYWELRGAGYCTDWAWLFLFLCEVELHWCGWLKHINEHWSRFWALVLCLSPSLWCIFIVLLAWIQREIIYSTIFFSFLQLNIPVIFGIKTATIKIIKQYAGTYSTWWYLMYFHQNSLS